MTRRKFDVERPFRPERVSRETMAYLLDMSADTFDRLVEKGKLPAAVVRSGIKRWNVEQVLTFFDTGENPKPFGASIDADADRVSDGDPLMANLGAFRGKPDRRRGIA